MKVHARNKKYDALIIRSDTDRNIVGNFINCHKAVSYQMHGIGFTADRTLTLTFSNGKVDLTPGTVIIKSKQNTFGIMDQNTYNLIFDEIKEDKIK